MNGKNAAGICRECRRQISIDAKTLRQLQELGLSSSGEFLCEPCARKLGLGNEVYEVRAGDLFQRFGGFRVRLWPVGTFQV